MADELIFVIQHPPEPHYDRTLSSGGLTVAHRMRRGAAKTIAGENIDWRIFEVGAPRLGGRVCPLCSEAESAIEK